ncbi:MAG: linear amide C-N hydrolase [Bacilli bacterium]|nr:linear amide C-N hydrolase [Bacilli bacterium]MDD4795022.1 linear amide C-N hydrolase [Bacilli bacterium]
MCTAMTLQSKNNEVFFGRTMDFSYEISPEVYIVPAGYEWISLNLI